MSPGKRKVDNLTVRHVTRAERPEWDRAVAASPQACVFSTSDWLDTYRDEDYVILGVVSDHRIVGGIVLPTRRGSLLRSKILGPLLPPLLQSDKRATRYEFEKRFLGILARAVRDACPHYEQRWHASLDNALPFRWEGFEQTADYTYLLDVPEDASALWDGFQTKIRGDVRKAEKAGIRVEDGGADDFLALHRRYHEARGSEARAEADLYRRVLEGLLGTAKARVRLTRAAEGTPLSAAIFLFDEGTVYYWAAAHDAEARGRGAQSLLLWSQLQELPAGTQCFDFLGSNVPDVERYFRGFGGRLTPVFRVSLPASGGLARLVRRVGSFLESR